MKSGGWGHGMLSNNDGVIKVIRDNGLVLSHTSHAMQVPYDTNLCSSPCTTTSANFMSSFIELVCSEVSVLTGMN